MELSGEFPVKLLCSVMEITRSSFYAWKNKLANPSERTKQFISHVALFKEYHLKYPSHGYRWLNAKIRLDLGVVYSDNYAHKICKFLNIKSQSRHFKRRGKKANRELKDFPNYS